MSLFSELTYALLQSYFLYYEISTLDMATTPLGRMVEGMVNTVSPRPEDGWTLGWDVVVSYTEKEVNETLNRSWDKVTIALIVPR